MKAGIFFRQCIIVLHPPYSINSFVSLVSVLLVEVGHPAKSIVYTVNPFQVTLIHCFFLPCVVRMGPFLSD